MRNDKNTLFTDTPVKNAVLTLAIPTVISQLITVVYNMADTFFVGQLNDPLQVAAATIAMPCYMFLTAFANLFGRWFKPDFTLPWLRRLRKSKTYSSILYLDGNHSFFGVRNHNNADGTCFVSGVGSKSRNVGIS